MSRKRITLAVLEGALWALIVFLGGGILLPSRTAHGPRPGMVVAWSPVWLPAAALAAGVAGALLAYRLRRPTTR